MNYRLSGAAIQRIKATGLVGFGNYLKKFCESIGAEYATVGKRGDNIVIEIWFPRKGVEA